MRYKIRTIYFYILVNSEETLIILFIALFTLSKLINLCYQRKRNNKKELKKKIPKNGKLH